MPFSFSLRSAPALFILTRVAACASADDGGERPPTSAATPTSGSLVGAVDAAAAARTAVVLASCTTRAPAEHLLVEMYQRVRPAGSPHETGALVRCIDDHRNGCRAVEACLAATVGPLRRGTGCAGDVAENEQGTTSTLRVDCAQRGQSCAVIGAVAECVEATGARCSVDDPPRCSADGRPVRCRAGHESFGVACASLGLACSVGPSIAYCTGTEGGCTNASPPSPAHVTIEPAGCDAERVSACIGGERATLDCGALVATATCRTSAPDGAPFCGIAGECHPGKAAAEGCDGDAVLVCGGGRLERVDCKELGFTSCTNARSIFGEPYAMCL